MPSTLQMGSNGSEVKTLQGKLNSLLRPSPKLDVDGIFGSLTDHAVRKFQQEKKLDVDGIVGPNTWGALNAPTTATPSAPADPATPPGPTYEIAEKAAYVALFERGVMESPLGSNSGPKVNLYLASVGLPPGCMWCMAFVHWCFYAASGQLWLPNPCLKTGLCAGLAGRMAGMSPSGDPS